MTEPDGLTAGTLSQRTQIAASPDWQNLLTYFDLSGEGFAFIVLLVPDGEWAEACRQALERYLLAYRKKVVTVHFDGADEFRDELASRLLSLRVEEDTGAIWVGAAVPEVSKEYEKWQGAWGIGVARLNQYRNPLREQFDVPLLFVGAPWVQTTLREMAPDLWSVRTLVVRIEPSAINAEIANRFSSTESYTTDLDLGLAIDPDFALKEAMQLRGRPGKELALSRLLYRAGLGLMARYRSDEAERVLKEAMELHYRYGEETEELAELLEVSGRVFIWKAEYEQASASLLEALRIYQQSSNILGEVNCIRNLGDIALQRSQLDEAETRFKQALSLYQQMRQVLGEANCIDSLGDIALRRLQFEEARADYEQALSLYKKIGDLMGEANSIMSLGYTALMYAQYDEAETYYEQALLIFQRLGDVLGEANCIQGLGNIALNRSQYEEARRRFEQALPLYRRVGDVLGEANCIQSLGDIALEQGEVGTAKQSFITALELYERINDPYSIGFAHQRLARVATNEAERQQHIQAARAAWESIGLTDLIKDLDEEFSTVQ